MEAHSSLLPTQVKIENAKLYVYVYIRARFSFVVEKSYFAVFSHLSSLALFPVHAISFRVLGLHIHGPSRYIRRRHSSSEGVPAHLVGGQLQRNDALTPLERKRDIVAQKKIISGRGFVTVPKDTKRLVAMFRAIGKSGGISKLQSIVEV